GARRADGRLGGLGHLGPRGGGEAMRGERGLQGHDRPPRGERLTYLVGHEEVRGHGIAPTRARQTPAARRPRRTASSKPPPRRIPAASASPAPVVSTTGPVGAGSSSRRPPSLATMPCGPRFSTQAGGGSSPPTAPPPGPAPPPH